MIFFSGSYRIKLRCNQLNLSGVFAFFFYFSGTYVFTDFIIFSGYCLYNDNIFENFKILEGLSFSLLDILTIYH